jgi:hypothetical protein
MINVVHLAGQLREHAETLAALVRRSAATPERPQHRRDLPVPQPRRRLTPVEVEELEAAYLDGGTVRGLAVEYGIHHTTVMAHLDRAGVSRSRARPLPAEHLMEARRMYEAGSSLKTIAREFSVDWRQVRVALDDVGVTIRLPKGRQ